MIFGQFVPLASFPAIKTLLGADVSHAGPGVNKPSIASIVWSMDQAASVYKSVSSVQHPRAEIITNLGEMVKTAILSFVQVAKAPPSRIIFYRDGVSEGEFDTVKQREIPAIQGKVL